MNVQTIVQVPSVSFQVLHRRLNSSEKAQAMEQRTSSSADPEQALVPLDVKPDPKYYRVGVAAHLPARWRKLSGVVNLTQDVTPAGLNISMLELRIDDHSNLLDVLIRLHEDNQVILSVNALR